MKLIFAIFATQLIKAQDYPWPGVMQLEHIQDGVILAEAKLESESLVEKPDAPKEELLLKMINTGQKDWEITQLHDYNEETFLQANITLDPFTEKNEADNQKILD